MSRAQLTTFFVVLCLAPLSRAEAQELPETVAGLLGMGCFEVTRAFEAAGHTLEPVTGREIRQSGAGDMSLRSVVVSGTGLFLYCDHGRVAGFAAGLDWGEVLFRDVFPGFAPFDSAESVLRVLGSPVDGSFAERGGDGSGTWVRGRQAILYSVCLRC